MTQLEQARNNVVTEEMRQVAVSEGRDPDFILEGIRNGTIVIPKNINRKISRICGVGTGLPTKVNANIGTSISCDSIDLELKKLYSAVDAGADTVMDLSTGTRLTETRSAILKECPVPIGTVPIYEVIVASFSRGKSVVDIKWEDILECLVRQAREGVDFFTIHSGVTREAVARMRAEGRILDVVSRGGAFIVEWMESNNAENPFFEHFDEIVELAGKYDVTLSLGDGMRPGALADATDRGQVQELITLGELAKRAQDAGVQVMIEGPGHVPLHQVKANIELEKALCGGAPFYVLGPLVTDIAPGYDHITSAIGGAIAASAGADFLCVVTPSEHLSLPDPDDVREGVIASKIAAHAGDIAKGLPGAATRDNMMSAARKRRDWQKQMELALDPVKARKYRERSRPTESDVCSMCDKFCSIRIYENAGSGGK